MQACANILQHTCVASEGQSGAGMWDTSAKKIHSILTGKVSCSCTLLDLQFTKPLHSQLNH